MNKSITHVNYNRKLKLIFSTFFILFMPESTEGIAAGQTTALDYENEENRKEKWEKREEHWMD